MVMDVCAVCMTIAELNPVMSKVVESVSVATFPAAAVMDELSVFQLAMVLAIAISAGDTTAGDSGGVVSGGGVCVGGGVDAACGVGG